MNVLKPLNRFVAPCVCIVAAGVSAVALAQPGTVNCA